MAKVFVRNRPKSSNIIAKCINLWRFKNKVYKIILFEIIILKPKS